jgi:hypothetical protein
LGCALFALAGGTATAATLLTDNFTGGSSAITFSVIGAGSATYATDSGAGTLESAALKFQAANLNTLVGLFPSRISLGTNPGDTLAVSFKVRQEENFTGYFRFGLFNIGPINGTGDDTGYYVDYGDAGSGAAWYATGGPANYFGTGTPSDPSNSGAFSLSQINLTTPISLTLRMTRTETGANFDAINGSTVIYTVSHSSPVTTFDELAVFTQQARVIWLDDITVTSTTSVPEPASCASLAGVFMLGFGAARRRRSKRANS